MFFLVEESGLCRSKIRPRFVQNVQSDLELHHQQRLFNAALAMKESSLYAGEGGGELNRYLIETLL